MNRAKLTKFTLAAGIALAIAGQSSDAAVTVDYGAYPGQPNVITSGATPVVDGNEVRIGYLTAAPADPANVQDVNAVFVLLGMTRVRSKTYIH